MKLSFVHIPKTGGSEFVRHTIDFWPRELVSPHTDIQGFMCDPDPSKYYFTAGHVFYEKIKSMFSPDRYYMTILREPIQRVCSHWIHIRKFNLTTAKTIEEFIYESEDREFAHNLMAKYLGWWPKDYQGVPNSSGDIERIPLDITEDELYTRAFNNLKEFWHVGIQDRWVESVRKVYTEFNRALPDNIKQGGAQDYRLILSQQILKDLAKFNRVDIELYNYFKD